MRSIPDEVERVLRRLDGDRWYALMLWQLPAGEALDQVPQDYPQEYIQTAGSADRLTVEVREFSNGAYQLFVIGRDSAMNSLRPETISWNEYAVTVQPNEVLTAADAVTLFMAYLAGLELPAGYAKRPR